MKSPCGYPASNPANQRDIFAIAGLLSGLDAAAQVDYLESADPNTRIALELSAIAAVVSAGTSLMGGRGSVANTFFGVRIIAAVQKRLAQVDGFEPTERSKGAVIVFAVILDVYRHKFSR